MIFTWGSFTPCTYHKPWQHLPVTWRHLVWLMGCHLIDSRKIVSKVHPCWNWKQYITDISHQTDQPKKQIHIMIIITMFTIQSTHQIKNAIYKINKCLLLQTYLHSWGKQRTKFPQAIQAAENDKKRTFFKLLISTFSNDDQFFISNFHSSMENDSLKIINCKAVWLKAKFSQKNRK